MAVDRQYFHEERMPGVLFVVNGEICSGMIRDITDDGLNILTDWNVRPEVGTEIANLYVGQLQPENAIENLIITRVRAIEANKKMVLGIFLNDDEKVKKFRQILKRFHSPNVRTLEADLHVDHTRLPKIDSREHYTTLAVEQRLSWLEKCTGQSLDNVRINAFRPESLVGNIENFVGAVQIPLGIAGPLKVNGLYAQGHFPLPIATSEGALVASLSRGCLLLNKAGGVNVHVVRQKMLRAPVFICQDLHGALNVEKWIHQHLEQITQKAQSVSSVAKLIELKTFVFGSACHVLFYFHTGDAAGQNMTTSCTFFACEWMIKEIAKDPYNKFIRYMIDANMAGDKKANAQNFIQGRGVAVVAQVFVPGDLIRDYLRISPEDLVEGYSISQVSGTQIGMMGNNVNFANVVAGMFASCGQDLASIHESALGIFQIHGKDGGIFYNAYLPSLVIGTVGGGTRLPSQLECLKMMGCDGQGQLFKLAEIIASACLALDISTTGAVMSHDFVKAHETLGRNRPQKRLGKAELDARFFHDLMDQKMWPDLVIEICEELALSSNQGIVSELVANKMQGPFGIFKYNLKLGPPYQRDLAVILKLKSSQQELEKLAIGLARLSGEDALPRYFEQGIDIFGFQNSDTKEIEFYQHFQHELASYLPKFYGSRIDSQRDLYALLLEDLSAFKHIHTIHKLHVWTAHDVEIVCRDLAQIHGPLLSPNLESLQAKLSDKMKALIPYRSVAQSKSAMGLLQELLSYNAQRFPNSFPASQVASLREFVSHYDERCLEMHGSWTSLSHNDFNPRNMCLRASTSQIPEHLVCYDWELASWQNPQHDLIEFLIYVADQSWNAQTYQRAFESYRKHLEAKAKVQIARKEFYQVSLWNAQDLAVNRLGLYWLIHNVRAFDFLPQVTQNLFNLIGHVQGFLHEL